MALLVYVDGVLFFTPFLGVRVLQYDCETQVPDFGADSDDDAAGGGIGEEGSAPSSMIVQFATLEGENKGPQIDVPLGSTVLQMEELMNQLLENRNKVQTELRWLAW